MEETKIAENKEDTTGMETMEKAKPSQHPLPGQPVRLFKPPEVKPKYLEIDLETYSLADLKKTGVYPYTEQGFEIELLSFTLDDGDVWTVDMAGGEVPPEWFIAALEDPEIIKVAWNAQFERTCLSHYLGHRLLPDQWQCAMVWAASLSLPRSLDAAGRVLNTGEKKDKAGKDLIRYFAGPCRPTKSNGGRTRNMPSDAPEKWQMYKDYNAQDVRTERDIRKRLERFPMDNIEWDFYHMDQAINDRGVQIDTDLARAAIHIFEKLSGQMTDRMKELTGLANPNSVMQLKDWLDERGVDIPSLGKKDVEDTIKELEKGSLDAEAAEVLNLRLQIAKSSVKKYQAALTCTCADGRARGLFLFYGATRTQRWSGTLLQLQNLKRNSLPTLSEARELVKMEDLDALEMIYGRDEVTDILSQLVRTMLIPKPGCEFIVADFSAIEARVLAWEAGEQWSLDAFREGRDLYCATASAMFGVPVEKHGRNAELRQKGKIAVLACGYGGGIGALKSMGALDMGLTESELPDIIENWRKANGQIVSYWHDLQDAAVETIKDHQSRTVKHIEFDFYANTLWVILPSGRKLAYLKPRLQPNEYGYMSITYEGPDSSASMTSGRWGRVETYYGKICENITQAIARDILATSMLRFEKAGINIVGHIHDEVILEVPKGKYTVDEMCALMAQNPDWCPDLPLAAAGYLAPDWYFKD